MRRNSQFSREELRSLLAGRNISQLAEKLGVSRPTIYAWLKGPQMPNAQQLVDLAEALSVSPSKFYVPKPKVD